MIVMRDAPPPPRQHIAPKLRLAPRPPDRPTDPTAAFVPSLRPSLGERKKPRAARRADSEQIPRHTSESRELADLPFGHACVLPSSPTLLKLPAHHGFHALLLADREHDHCWCAS